MSGAGASGLMERGRGGRCYFLSSPANCRPSFSASRWICVRVMSDRYFATGISRNLATVVASLTRARSIFTVASSLPVVGRPVRFLAMTGVSIGCNACMLFVRSAPRSLTDRPSLCHHNLSYGPDFEIQDHENFSCPLVLVTITQYNLVTDEEFNLPAPEPPPCLRFSQSPACVPQAYSFRNVISSPLRPGHRARCTCFLTPGTAMTRSLPSSGTSRTTARLRAARSWTTWRTDGPSSGFCRRGRPTASAALRTSPASATPQPARGGSDQP